MLETPVKYDRDYFVNHQWNRRIFNTYLLSDLRFLSGIYERQFSDDDRVDINTAFEVQVERLYQQLRKDLESVVIDEFEGHFNFRTFKGQSGGVPYEASKIARNKDYFTIRHCFEKIRWRRYFGGKKWGKATSYLLVNPKTTDDKMFWIDRVLDLEHNTGGIFHGKGCCFSDLYEGMSITDFGLRRSDIKKVKISLLDIRALVPSYKWGNMCELKLWNDFYKYVKRARTIYQRIS